jgi:acylphosphatase
MDQSKSHERRVIHFRGHVQGVGFRYTAVRIGAGFEVSGFVQNLADGRVRLVAEGNAEELNRFVDELVAQMAAYIHEVQSDTHPATGEFDDFDIRH